jgi:hypothetical protein
VPIKEMSCPLKKSWKLRWRNARPAACQRLSVAPLAATFSGMPDFDSATIARWMMLRHLALHYIALPCFVSASQS